MRQIFPKSRHRIRARAFHSICQILSVERKYGDFLNADASDPFWLDFTDMAMDHLVVPALAHRLVHDGAADRLPPLVRRYLDAMLRLNRSRNQQIREEALDLADALNEIDIVPVFLKGSAGLLAEFYDEPGFRVMSDMDVLVPLDRAEDCRHHLAGLGYRPQGKIDHPRNKSVETFVRRASVAPIDLHHQPLDFEYENVLAARDVMKNAVTHRWHHVEFAVPSMTHQVMINIAHAQLNDHGYWFGNLPIRLLLDLALFKQRANERIDWRRVEKVFTETRNGRALEFHLYAARKLLGVETGIDVRPRLATRLLFWRSISLMGFPRLQRFGFRFIRVYLLLMRELSAAELRARLLRNMADPGWWQRHLVIFWKGTR